MLSIAAKWLTIGTLLISMVEGRQLKPRQKPDEIITHPVSNITSLTPQFFTDRGSRRQKVTYGPFTVPSMDIDDGMEDFELYDVTIGCTNCTITYIEAGLEYPNGTYANANTSLWLHHTVLYNINATDSVCGNSSFHYPERFFAAGNERTHTTISANGTDKTGYYVAPNATIVFLAELMNQAMVNQTAVVTITFETIPGFPSDFRKSVPIWLDIGGCDASEQPPKDTSSFSYTSPSWNSTVSGRISMGAGHIHDGGTHLAITQNGNTWCDSVADYAQTPGYIDGPGVMMNMSLLPNDEMSEMGKHISSMTACSTGSIKEGDALGVEAFYDFTKWTPMVNSDGSLTDIMGIGMIYVSLDEAGNGTSGATTSGSAAPSSTSKAAGSRATAAAGIGSGLIGSAAGVVAMLLV